MTDRLTLRGSCRGTNQFLDTIPRSVPPPPQPGKKDAVMRVFHSKWTCFFLAWLKGRFLPIVCHVKERTQRHADVSQKFANTMGWPSRLLRALRLSRNDDGRGPFYRLARPSNRSVSEDETWARFIRLDLCLTIDSYTDKE